VEVRLQFIPKLTASAGDSQPGRRLLHPHSEQDHSRSIRTPPLFPD
jgi:hypothetical protein